MNQVEQAQKVLPTLLGHYFQTSLVSSTQWKNEHKYQMEHLQQQLQEMNTLNQGYI